MRGVVEWVGGWLVFTCPRWPFRGRVCDSQSTSASMRSRLGGASEKQSHTISAPQDRRGAGWWVRVHLWPWFREPDKCDVISRACFMLTAPRVPHLSVLMGEKGLREKHGGTEEMSRFGAQKISKNLLRQHHSPDPDPDPFSHLRFFLKCSFCNRQAVPQKLHVCYVFSLAAHPLCLISEQLLVN